MMTALGKARSCPNHRKRAQWLRVAGPTNEQLQMATHNADCEAPVGEADQGIRHVLLSSHASMVAIGMLRWRCCSVGTGSIE
eukprot:2593327-Rhodomonas_salina.1